MYGQLTFDASTAAAPWLVSFFVSHDVALPDLTVVQAVERGNAVKRLRAEVPDLTPAEEQHLARVCRALPKERNDPLSDLFLGLIHLRLPTEEREQREARIAATLDPYFGDVPLPPQMIAAIDTIKLTAPLAPDDFMEDMVRGQASRLQMTSMVLPAWVQHCIANVGKREHLIKAMGVVSRSEDDRVLADIMFTQTRSQQGAFLDLLEHAVGFKLLVAVRKTVAAMRDLKLLLVIKNETVIKVLQACREAALDGTMEDNIDTVVADQVALAELTNLAHLRAVLSATLLATEAGVSLGRLVDAQNRAAVMVSNVSRWRELLRMTPDRLRLRNKLDHSSAPRPASVTVNSNDLDPVHAWSVGRLLQWIEGPIADAAPARLERARFVAQEKTARQDARQKTRMDAAALRNERDLTEVDIDLAVQNALNTTADFYIADIDDMLFRARTLDVASPAIEACAELLGPLIKLKGEDRTDDQKARALLHQASMAVDMMRREIRAKESDVRVRQRFAQQLQAALFNEPMVEGKRHGGVINCPLKRSDWPWVAEQYHRRWLPWNRSLTVDGVPRALQSDQALGLYVTGKSLSGYEFDVSVHLWVRMRGRESAPGTSNSPFSPMNTNDWIDTLTPCAVLHVRSAG